MSKFMTLNKDVLLQVAEHFGVDLPEVENEKDLTKAIIIAEFVEQGVTWEIYKEAFPDIEDIPDEPRVDVKTPEPEEDDLVEEFKKPEQTVLLKMERQNPLLQIRGYTFKRDHPFVPVSQADAEYILTHETGFKIAMPSEAEAFYK